MDESFYTDREKEKNLKYVCTSLARFCYFAYARKEVSQKVLLSPCQRSQLNRYQSVLADGAAPSNSFMFGHLPPNSKG